MPFIEDIQEAVDLYKSDPDAFWGRLWDEDDPFHNDIKLLLVDGGHRHYVTNKLKYSKMHVVFLRPPISYGELVKT